MPLSFSYWAKKAPQQRGFLTAERQGFEPWVEQVYTRFPSVLLRPLGHLSSISKIYTRFPSVLLRPLGRFTPQRSVGSGEAGIRTLGRQSLQRFSRPPRSTTPAPLPNHASLVEFFNIIQLNDFFKLTTVINLKHYYFNKITLWTRLSVLPDSSTQYAPDDKPSACRICE